MPKTRPNRPVLVEPDAQHLNYRIRYFDGRTRYAETGAASRTEAQARLEEFAAADRAALGDDPEPTFGDLVDLYLASRTPKGAAKATLKNWRVFLGERRLSTLTLKDCAEYLKRRAHLAPGTREGEMKMLATVRNWACKLGHMPPERRAALCYLERPKRVTVRAIQWLTEDQTDALFAHAVAYRRQGRMPREAVFACIAIDTGARKRAIERLTWDRVHIDTPKPSIDFEEAGREISIKRRAQTPIPSRLAFLLKQVRQGRTTGYVLDTFGSVHHPFKAMIAGTAFDGTRIHILRHSYVTNAYYAGVALKDIADAIGDTEKMLRDTYRHIAADSLHDAVVGVRETPKRAAE